MLQLKLGAIFQRLLAVVALLPLRSQRFVKHLWTGLRMDFKSLKVSPDEGSLSVVFFWFFELIIYFLEIFGFGEMYETFNDLVKFNSRPLTESEIELGKTVFNNTVNYRRVRIDEHSYLGPRQKQFCYVSFYMVNSWGPMPDDILIHELIHIWQYERLGAVYMPRALRAQQTKLGYNYGGISGLVKAYNNKARLTSFNLEQQGDIVADYFRIKKGLPPRWGKGSQQDLNIYQFFIDQLSTEIST